MKLRYRFMLLGAGFLLFCLVTPILVLYARGYKFDFASKKLLKTGSLVAETEPAKAHVELNGKPLPNGQTPATIRFLLPGDYEVAIKKDGYQTWSKRLSVKSQLVTWANFERESVALFLTQAQSLHQQKTDYAVGSREDGKIILISEGKVFEMEPQKDKPNEIGNLSDLTPFNPSIALTKENIYQLLKNRGLLSLTTQQLNQLGRIESNERHIAAAIGSDLYRKPAGAGSLALAVSDAAAFTLYENELWYLRTDGALNRMNLQLGLNETVKTGLPIPVKDSRILRTPNHVFVTVDGTLYSINGEITKLYEGVTDIGWDRTGQKLVFSNNHEVLVYDPLKLRSELILRSTTGIQNPTLNENTGYLFFMNENKIKAVELDGRDHRNIYELAEAPHSHFMIDSEGSRLLIYSDTGFGLYRIR